MSTTCPHLTGPDQICTICQELQALRVVRDAVVRAGLDVSPCRLCGEPVVCVPDGLPLCCDCAAKEEQ